MADRLIDNVLLGYDDIGTGENTLLLIHGHPFDRTMWIPQHRAALDRGWRLVAPDLRGYGRSATVPGTTTLDTFATDLAALLDDLGIGQVVVGGLSMGGQIAMEFCRRFPARVRGLLLAATFPQAESAEGVRRRNAMADRLLREGMAGYADEALPSMLAPASIEADPATARSVHTMMRRTDPIGAAAALRGRALRPDYSETLRSLDIPSTVIVGSADAFTSRQDADRMRSLLRGSVLAWLDGAGHMPNLERPELFNRFLSLLLERVEEGERSREGAATVLVTTNEGERT